MPAEVVAQMLAEYASSAEGGWNAMFDELAASLR